MRRAFDQYSYSIFWTPTQHARSVVNLHKISAFCSIPVSNPWYFTRTEQISILTRTGSGDIILPYVDDSANDANSYNFAGTSLHRTHTEGFAGQTDSGPVYEDDVTFAGLTGNNVQFFAANETREAPANDANAIIGMDYTTESNSGFAGYFETLTQRGQSLSAGVRILSWDRDAGTHYRRSRHVEVYRRCCHCSGSQARVLEHQC